MCFIPRERTTYPNYPAPHSIRYLKMALSGKADQVGPMDAQRAWRVLAADVGHWQLRGYGRWSVIEKTTNHMIGGCGLWWPEGYQGRS